VDACLLTCVLAPAAQCDACAVFTSLASRSPKNLIGYVDGHLVADMDRYLRWQPLLGPERYRWRSGVKHDCAGVMELQRTHQGYVNGLDESVDIEDEFVYPLYKSSDVARGRCGAPDRYVLLTQKRVGEDTSWIKDRAPKTWRYLERHASRLDARRSSIYTGQPRFAVFGVGDYAFAPWKVAVSGLYHGLEFRVLAPDAEKPALLDDTCYFIGCDSAAEAEYISGLLNSQVAHEFFSAFLFPDAKRPVTIDLLRKLDLLALARELGSEEHLQAFLDRQATAKQTTPAGSVQVALSL
jgi:hypothetical protein